MTDTEGMTPTERANAYEVEAAQMIDRTIRKLPEGVTTAASLKLVELIVLAAVERMSAATNIAVVPTQRCPETWQPAVGGAVGRCTLPQGHPGKHLMESRSGVPCVYPGEVCHDSPASRGELATGITQNEAGLRAQAAERVEFGSTCAAAFRCTLAPNHDGLHKFEPE
jgi:hypothetical protein